MGFNFRRPAPPQVSALERRFSADRIYTFCGLILIASNPFKHISFLYDDDTLRSYLSQGPKANRDPHIFAVASAALRALTAKQRPQILLISGESGSGKTETTKFAMKFMTAAGATSGEPSKIEQQVLDTNPILEAFGNAKTLRNNNSSRFGKFIALQFTPHDVAVQSRLSGHTNSLKVPEKPNCMCVA